MHVGGLLSFAVGGTLLMFLFIDIIDAVLGYGNTFTWSSWLYPEAAVLGFISFLLIGYGLFVNMRSAKGDTKPN